MTMLGGNFQDYDDYYARFYSDELDDEENADDEDEDLGLGI